jgi:hypothetical protein
MKTIEQREYNQRYYANKREALVNYARARRAENAEQIRAADRARYARNPEKKIQQSTASARRCADRKRAYNKQWREKNGERAKATARAYGARIRKTPEGAIRNRISCQLYDALHGRKLFRTSESLLGYSISELRAHLEKQFLRGMSWENMGLWHIDHITPLSSFKITSVDDAAVNVKRAWALPNLRPLWAADNIKKSNRIEVLV